MSTKQKSTALYANPFSKAYWHDAAAELKDVHMLAIAALLIALRVALKGVFIPLAPNLNINVAAPLINALGAMIFGPVVAIPAAFISDTLGCILFPQGAYFFPCALVEVAGSVLFALFFYRAKITVTRVILARFSMDLLVNICLNSGVMFWYYKVIMGKSYAAMVLPAAIKNLCMFPIEAFMLALFFSVLIPVTYRMKLTYDSSADRNSLKFNAKQLGLMACLFVVAAGVLFSYMFYHYNTNSLSASYSASERYDANCRMGEIVVQEVTGMEDATVVATVESAYKQFTKGKTTYNVAVYVVDEDALASYDKDLNAIRGMSKSKAKAVASDGVMENVGMATIVVDNKTGQTLSFEMK